MSASKSRKRRASGASPTLPAQHGIQQPLSTDNVSDAMAQWSGSPDAFAGSNTYGTNPFSMPSESQFRLPSPPPSNAVARRQMNQALMPANQTSPFETGTDMWPSFGDVEGALVPQNFDGGGATAEDNIEKLEEQAAKAKRQAQAKRKQIPPFVQKLSSFLEERKNEELIRWSEKGDSFIVLDEEEFAKTLIPELFKHNNYASFVRQLNMYGFHKCVGLSDNSMRANERKNKSPSEYSNIYFRRGHPNLLWLISKPKNKRDTASKNSNGSRLDSDEEALNEDNAIHVDSGSVSIAANRALPSTESAPSPKKEIHVIRDEIQKVREQQKLILGAINSLQRNNNELYNQALMFQNQHDRHQNSINAILNFLGNVYRKTIEDQNNNQNVSDLLSSILNSQGQQGHGNVVDLGDLIQTQMDSSGSLPGSKGKRTRGLLPPIPGQEAPTQQSRQPFVSNYGSGGMQHSPEMGHVTELFDSETPPSLRQELEDNPQERILKIINEHKPTNNLTPLDPAAAELVANTPNTLNNDQRSQLVRFMAAQRPLGGSASATPGSSVPATTTVSPPPPPSPPLSSRPRTMGASSASPDMARFQSGSNSATKASPPSLSSIMRSPVMATPSLNQIRANEEELQQLQRLQSEQDAKISELGELLGPLSPSGRIPGLDGSGENYFDGANVDLDQYFNNEAFMSENPFGDGSDFNFNIDAAEADAAAEALAQQQRRKDAPSPTAGKEVTQRDDFNSPVRDFKRPRTT